MCKVINRPFIFIIYLIYNIIYVESKFEFNKSPLNNDFISKDLSELGLNVYLEEFDFIPREVSISVTNREVCKNSLKINYENDVYGLCEYFKCDIRTIASLPYDSRKLPLSDPPSKLILPITTEITEEQRKNCNLSKLAARCSTYLRFANCIYVNYIESVRINTSSITLEEKALQIFRNYPNNELVNQYNSIGGGSIGFLFKEYLQNICSYVHTSCVELHPQFKGVSDYFFSQACVVFDIITPLSGYDNLFYKTNNEKTDEYYISRDKEVFTNYQIYSPPITILSQLNIPLDIPFNSPTDLSVYKDRVMKYRCDLMEYLYVCFI